MEARALRTRISLIDRFLIFLRILHFFHLGVDIAQVVVALKPCLH